MDVFVLNCEFRNALMKLSDECEIGFASSEVGAFCDVIKQISDGRMRGSLTIDRDNLARLAVKVGLSIAIVRRITAEAWRLSRERANPKAAGSRGVAEVLIRRMLCEKDYPLESYYVVEDTLEGRRDGMVKNILSHNDRLVVAATAYVLARGGRYFNSHQEWRDAVSQEKWPGYEELLGETSNAADSGE